MITKNPPIHERRQQAHAHAMNHAGTNALIASLAGVHGPVRYSRSIARNAVVCGSTVAGAGNQNMLDPVASTVNAIPHHDFLYAK